MMLWAGMISMTMTFAGLQVLTLLVVKDLTGRLNLISLHCFIGVL